MAKKNSKVIRYRKPKSVNIGFLIFAFIFIYLAYSVIAYMVRDKVQFYEVGREVALVKDSTYTGLILRTEEVTTAQAAGYVNFYIREGNRASVNSVVYSLDENGQFTEMLTSNASDSSKLSHDNLSDLKRSLANFNLSYQNEQFVDVYDLKYTIDNKLLSFVSTNSLEDLEGLGIDTRFFRTVPAEKSGVIEYYTDGFEGFDAASVDASAFDKSKYERTDIRSSQAVESGAPVYKTITSEVWSILIPLTEEEAAAYRDVKSLDVTFPEKGLSTTVSFSVIAGADNGSYGKMDLSRFMVQFADQRYLEVEIHNSVKEGLKIPKSSVLEKEFYTVPIGYGTETEDGIIFNKESYSAEGTSVEMIQPTVYYATQDVYYLDPYELEGGLTLVKPDSNDRYTLGERAALKGVYNVNKGYAVFKQIEVMDENEEYLIVEKGTDYGIAVYDHILLDSRLAVEGDILY
ncbi:HlyD family efflux transporter periplasmic adaptor subunit [Hominifimenecus sp. rT4P-3]|uniref:HlyD family efflux transporter periplasmic adaptor subunit n=1 Tax=Hominifimenecus sp. rT4P-3 TaxID=3242979 RepID=UPI003DA1F556